MTSCTFICWGNNLQIGSSIHLASYREVVTETTSFGTLRHWRRGPFDSYLVDFVIMVLLMAIFTVNSVVAIVIRRMEEWGGWRIRLIRAMFGGQGGRGEYG